MGIRTCHLACDVVIQCSWRVAVTVFVVTLVVYSRVPGDRNWHIETADWNLAGFFTISRNLLAGIWGSFLMMMIAFITFKSSLVPLLEGL